MTPKELKKLAAACRVAGIKTYKDKEIEFTLSDEVPVSNYKKKANKIKQSEAPSEVEFESDSLTEEQLLMWSVSNLPEDASEKTE